MEVAADRGGLAATRDGNLTVAEVTGLLEWFDTEAEKGANGKPRRVEEKDVRVLHLSRVLLEFSGVLARDKRRFFVTRLGERLLSEESAGELFALLFATYFKRIDLDTIGVTVGV